MKSVAVSVGAAYTDIVGREIPQQLEAATPSSELARSKNPPVLQGVPMIKAFLNDESGATAIEYGLIAGLVAVAIIAALTALGGSLDTLFSEVASTVSGATTGS